MTMPPIEQITSHAEAGQPEAQFLLSQICLQNGDLKGMAHWLTEACSSGHAEALGALGNCFEKGRGFASDMTAAQAHYDQAISAGSKMAAFHKAQLLHKSSLADDSADLIRALLIEAAKAGIVPALRTVGFLAAQQNSSRDLAVSCLRLAASIGDPVSSFNLGWCLMNGRFGAPAVPEATHWLQQAELADYPLAAELLGTLSPAPSEAPPPATVDDIDFTVDFPLFPSEKSAEEQTYSTDPEISVFNDVLDAMDCSYLIFVARPYLQRAAVIDPVGDKSGMISQVRTNQSTYIPFELVDIISRYAELKITKETGENISHSEPMSILCYGPGEYYRPHFDFFNPNLDASKELMEDGGQRVASAVSYLRAPSKGGGTSFPELNLTVPAENGATLWFRNCLANGDIDKRSLHAGDDVEAGQKWVVTKWFRERPTQYLQI